MRLSFIAVILALLLGGCQASKPLLEFPDIPYGVRGNLTGINKFAVYVHPTGNSWSDKLLENLIQADLITRGYEVVGISQIVSNTSLEYLSALKSFRTIGDYLNTLSMLETVDAIIVVSTKQSTYTNSYRELPCYDGRLAIVRKNEKAPVYLARLADSTRGVSNAFIAPPEHPRFMYERGISKILDVVPFTPKEVDLEGAAAIPLDIWVDESYRETFRRDWEDRINRRVLFLNDFYASQTRFRFVIKEIQKPLTWFTEDLNAELYRHIITSPRGPWISVRMTVDRRLAGDWFILGQIGLSSMADRACVVTAIPLSPGLEGWASIEEAYTLAHEIGHALGLPHIHDPQSLMYPTIGVMSFRLDSVSLQMLNALTKDYLELKASDRVERHLRILDAWTVSPLGNNAATIQAAAGDIDYLWRNSRGISSIDTTISADTSDLNPLIARLVSSEMLAEGIRGLFHLRHNRYEAAVAALSKARELGPDHLETLQLLAVAYAFDGDQSNAGFTINDLLDKNPQWFQVDHR